MEVAMDLNEMREALAGIDTQLKTLRKKELQFAKITGLEEQLEKNKQLVANANTALENTQDELVVLEQNRTTVIRDVCDRVQAAIDENLAFGKSVVEFTGKNELEISFDNNGRSVLYAGLSGGEKVIFDKALSVALAGDKEHIVVVVEAAELDAGNIDALLEDVDQQFGRQFIVLTCHEDWTDKTYDNIAFMRMD